MKIIIIFINFILITLILYNVMNSKIIEGLSGCSGSNKNAVYRQQALTNRFDTSFVEKYSIRFPKKKHLQNTERITLRRDRQSCLLVSCMKIGIYQSHRCFFPVFCRLILLELMSENLPSKRSY